jgi:potassium-dependent mechanosensitive channel
VNYAANPKKVVELLVGVAEAHPQVLKSRPPKAFLLSYGDSSINFELRAWTDQSHSPSQIKSDLAASVYDAVNAAGMSFPFPQREVRLLRDPEPHSNGDIVKPAAKSSPRSEEDKSA